MLLKYALLGMRVTTSLSPQIHLSFAQELGIKISYELLPTTSVELPLVLRQLQAEGYKGVNVTSPLKQEILQFITKPERPLYAVNTLRFSSKGEVKGYNTDGVGLKRDLSQYLRLAGASVLILGTGGASRGIIPDMLAAGVAHITVVGRNIAKATAVTELFRRKGTLQAISYNMLQEQQFNLIINATSCGSLGQLPPIPQNFKPSGICYDLAYGAAAKPFLKWAKQGKTKLALSGLGMLVEQAKEAFYLWHGVYPRFKNKDKFMTNLVGRVTL